MRIDILTLFPQMFDSFVSTSLIARGIQKKIFSINLFDIRSVATDAHKTVDGRPYGGGAGMVLRVDIVDIALTTVLKNSSITRSKTKIILLTPQGKVFDQVMSHDLSTFKRLIFICGHYEGFDERIRSLVDQEISLGDFVVTGGEFPSMVMIDAIARNLNGFLGKESSLNEESFSMIFRPPTSDIRPPLLEYPHYTRPEIYKGHAVPPVLLSGDHQKIALWRMQQSHMRTKTRRPDLGTD